MRFTSCSFVFLLFSNCVDPLDRGNNSSYVLFCEFLPSCVVEGFRIGPVLLNNPHFQMLPLKEFNIGCGASLVTGKRNLSCSSISVGIPPCDSNGQMPRCHRIANTTCYFIVIGSGFANV